MIAAPAITQRHPIEAELLACAVTGSPAAVDSVLNQLGSANPWLQKTMLETIRDNANPALWRHLLGCLALHQWNGRADIKNLNNQEIAAHIDKAIMTLFVESDEVTASTFIRATVLDEGLANSDCHIRAYSAILLGLRGDDRGIEVLIEAVRSGEPQYKLLAVGVLGKLKDERGGWALVEALASDNETLHREASRALEELGHHGLPALLDAIKSSPRPHARWHVVQILSAMDDLQAVTALAEALADQDYSVAWFAGDALARKGVQAIPAILTRLARIMPNNDSYQAAYHALHRIGPSQVQTRLQPLLNALRGSAALAEAPRVAFQLLQTWECDSQS